MRICCLFLCSLLSFWACTPDAPRASASLTLPAERNHLEAMAGFSLNVPDTWSLADESDSASAVQIMHGPAGTDAFYATLAIQRRVTLGAQRLDEAVALSLASIAHEPGFVWDNLALSAVGQDLALSYAVRFNALELAHRQLGIVFVHNAVLTAITLSAPSELFDGVLPVFQRAIDTLMMLPKAAKPPNSNATHTYPSARPSR